MSQATVREWTDVVRRARIGRTVYCVALTLASYADADGSRIFPGIARLSFDAKVGYNVAQQCLAELRQLRLVEIVRSAQSRGDADEYRLTLPDGLSDMIEVPNPSQARLAIETIRRRRQGRKARIENGDLHPTALGAALISQPVDNSDLHPIQRGAGLISTEEAAPHGVVPSSGAAPHFDVHLHPTPLAPTSHYLDTTTTSHYDNNLRTAVTGPRAPASDQDQFEPPSEDQTPPDDEGEQPPTQPAIGHARVPRPNRCPHRLADRDRGDGWSTCAMCRREAVQSKTAVFPAVTPREPPPDPPLADVIPIRRPA